jgi:hypothetical protein
VITCGEKMLGVRYVFLQLLCETFLLSVNIQEIMHIVHRDVHLGHSEVSILLFLPKLEYVDKFVVML